ncbi:MAG: hypothetical protein Q9164_005163 [Protoblastenia rupestris]
MLLTEYLLAALATASAVSGFTLRSKRDNNANSLQQREAKPDVEILRVPLIERFDPDLLSYLEKRRGGGGGSSGGGGRGGSSSSSSGSSGSTGGGSRNTGSASSSSSSPRAFGGGRYYAGGAPTPYRAGGPTPVGRILPFALVGGAIGAAAIFPGAWLYGAYGYGYNTPYSFRNRTNLTAQANDSLPVVCLCEEYQACGCDDNGDRAFLDELVGNGSYAALDKNLVTVSMVNGTRTLVLDGTLDNGTDSESGAASTSGSQAPQQTSTTSAAVGMSVVRNSGFWVAGGLVGGMVWLL